MSEAREVMAVVSIGQPPQKVRVVETTGTPLQPASHIAAASTNLGCKYLGGIIPNETFPPEDGLGDLLSNALTRIGLTKQRWSELVSTFKQKHEQEQTDGQGCGGCEARHKFMNWMGEKLGFSGGKGPGVQAVLELHSLSRQPIFKCEIHGKCLPLLNVAKETHQQLASDGWMGCGSCPDKVLKIMETQK